MAVWLAKSRTITHHLKRKVGFMGIFHQDLWTSSSSSSCMQPSPLSSIFIPGFHEHQYSSTPRLFPFNSSISTRFSLHRFKSTKAASQLEHLYSTDDDDHDNSQVNILIFNSAFLVDILFCFVFFSFDHELVHFTHLWSVEYIIHFRFTKRWWLNCLWLYMAKKIVRGHLLP